VSHAGNNFDVDTRDAIMCRVARPSASRSGRSIRRDRRPHSASSRASCPDSCRGRAEAPLGVEVWPSPSGGRSSRRWTASRLGLRRELVNFVTNRTVPPWLSPDITAPMIVSPSQRFVRIPRRAPASRRCSRSHIPDMLARRAFRSGRRARDLKRILTWETFFRQDECIRTPCPNALDSSPRTSSVSIPFRWPAARVRGRRSATPSPGCVDDDGA